MRCLPPTGLGIQSNIGVAGFVKRCSHMARRTYHEQPPQYHHHHHRQVCRPWLLRSPDLYQNGQTDGYRRRRACVLQTRACVSIYTFMPRTDGTWIDSHWLILMSVAFQHTSPLFPLPKFHSHHHPSLSASGDARVRETPNPKCRCCFQPGLGRVGWTGAGTRACVAWHNQERKERTLVGW